MDTLVLPQSLHSLEAEQAVLGSALIDSRQLPRIVGTLISEDFYYDTNRQIFETVCGMYAQNKPVEAVTVLDEMKRTGIYDPQTSQSYLIQLMDIVSTTANTGEYIRIVKDKTTLRRAWEQTERTRQAIVDGTPANEIVTRIANDSESLTRSEKLKENEQPNSEYMETLLDRIKNNQTGTTWETPWNGVNQAIGGGIKGGKLYVLGAGTGAGKTAFTMQIADYYAAEHQMPVIIVSMEMSRDELIARSMSRIAHANNSKSTLNSDQILGFCGHEQTQASMQHFNAAYNEYRETIAPKMTVIESEGNYGTAEIWGAMQRCYNQFGEAPLLVVDYLQLLHNPDSRIPEVQRLGNAAMELKRISRRYNCPVFCISSTNRQSNDKSASVSDFLGSSMIEYSADFALILKNEDETKNPVETGAEDCRRVKLVIAKGRSAKTNVGIPLQFWGAYSEYVEA